MTGIRYFKEDTGLNCDHSMEKEQNEMWIRREKRDENYVGFEVKWLEIETNQVIKCVPKQYSKRVF